MQTSYRLILKDGVATVWDTGVRESSQSTFVPYGGIPLRSRTRYTWTVRVRDSHGNTAEESTWFETAFLYPEDWKAVWVTDPKKPAKRKKGFGLQPAPVMFRRAFALKLRSPPVCIRPATASMKQASTAEGPMTVFSRRNTPPMKNTCATRSMTLPDF